MAQNSNSILPFGNDYDKDMDQAYKMLQSGNANQELQAQMIIDKVNEEITAKSNFEKAHHELMQAVTNNIGH